MKKWIFALTALVCFCAFSITALAASKIDKTNVSKGYATIVYDGNVKDKTVKLKVERVGVSSYYTYTVISNEPFNVPLQLGDGMYKLSLMENVSGTKYRILTSETFDVKVTSTNNEMYLIATPIVDFRSDSKAVSDYQKQIADALLATALGKVGLVYNDIIHRYVYDYDKMNAILRGDYPNGYVPVVDAVYISLKGICYDYASLTAAALRAAGIPVKVVMGYSKAVGDNVYHAWNEIFIDGKWIVADLTYDAVYAQANQAYKMMKDAKDFIVTKTY